MKKRDCERLLLWLCLGLLWVPLLQGQVPPPPGGQRPTNAPNGSLQAPPPSPVFKSPVSIFRELLAKTPEQRKLALAERPPEVRRQMMAKLREYEALRPDLRELRLKATELRWYLLPLLNSPATNRPIQLAAIPAEDRALIEARLRYWDALPPENQASLLTNQMTLRRLSELEEQSNVDISEARRKLLEAGIDAWQALPETERQNIKGRFDQLFTLTPDDKAKVLRTISEPERDQIQRTLRRFGQLAPHQRAQCIENFEKFANLTIEERQQFLKNADRWNTMTPDERQAWRDLVQKFQPQPPVPPRLPPMPQAARRPGAGVATNHN